MNGNNPYAGNPGVAQAGKRASEDVPELSAEQKRELRDSVTNIAALTREFLPGEYVVGSKVTDGDGGPQATVSVQPPVGHPVSAGLRPDADELTEDGLIEDEDRTEVARGLAASAALQVKQAMQNNVTPTAR